MSNMLDNGTVLPAGLLGENDISAMAGFNKSYKNFPLRVGVVTNSYPVSDTNNRSKLSNEYDVSVIEQFEDRGATTILYRNCLSSESFGSIADFFEHTLRPMKKKSSKGQSINLKDQDGAVVLLLCLDGMSDKGVIIACLTHPDRQTTLTNVGPYLEGEFNGINVKIATDGSATFTFNGATNNQGEVIDPSQGTTILQIEKDGSFQFNHDSITFRLDRTGTATLTANKDISLNANGNINITVKGNAVVQCVNATVQASGDALVKAAGKTTIEGKSVFLGEAAAESVIKGDTFKKLFDAHIHPSPVGPTGVPVMPLDQTALSKKVKTE